jgi:demethylmenaquinone methyltransferase / 2-methoxy-6-polyprenyl-1,4-benzoquinol methylase
MDNLPPDNVKNHKNEIGQMFDSIAWRYDFLNHFLSFGIDHLWRRKAIKIISESCLKPLILDVATGTGDLAIAAMRIEPSHVTGIDISSKMLAIGREKILKKGYDGRIELMEGDSENIPFGDNIFDVAMVAFGVRNFTDPLRGLVEMKRVIRDKGMILVLEFSRPSGSPFRQIFNFYFSSILPFIGRLFSKDKNAYTYLPESVHNFPDNDAFLRLLSEAGFSGTRQVKLTGGVASIYTGTKLPVQ